MVSLSTLFYLTLSRRFRGTNDALPRFTQDIFISLSYKERTTVIIIDFEKKAYGRGFDVLTSLARYKRKNVEA